jgi:hypothetical protein
MNPREPASGTANLSSEQGEGTALAKAERRGTELRSKLHVHGHENAADYGG